MKLALRLSLTKLIGREPRARRTSVGKQPRQRASAFVLEFLENRVLLSATPMDAPTAEPVMTAAVVTTDKADYSPGETAAITTSNTSADGLKFGDGELVQFQVTRTDGIQDYAMGNIPWFVTDGVGGFEAYQEYDANGQAVDRNVDGIADLIRPDNDLTVNGSISTNWFVEDQYLNSSLLLTATGQANGAVATTEFTDSGSFSYATTSGFANTVTLAAGATNSATLNTTVTAPAGNNSFNVSLSFETTAGTTIGIGSGTNQINLTSVTKGFVTSSNSGGPTSFGDSDTFPITVSVGSNVNAGTYHFKATAIESTSGVADGSKWSFDVIVSAAGTTTTVSSSDSTSTYGDAVAFTANVTGNPSVGTVQFFVDGNTFGSAVNVINGSATSGSISTLNAGNHNVHAVYSGGTGFTGSTSGTIVQSVSAKAISYTIGNDSHDYGSTTTFATLATSFLTGVNGETLSIGSYASVGNTTTSNVGTYALTGTVSDGTGLASNYQVAVTNGTLTVSAKVLTITVADTTKVFGQTINLAGVLGTTVNTGVNNENLVIAYTSAGEPVAALVGPYDINGSVSNGTGLLSNYNVTVNSGTLTVMTPSVITTVQDGANLIIVGTGGCDTISVNATNPSAITVNGAGSYSVGASGHVIVYGMACDDNISLTGNVNLEAHGGDGNDTITGGAGHDVIIGDTGNDTLTGAAGNDVLLGGAGSDRLVGSAGHDILVAGDLQGHNYNTLRTISDKWAANWTADEDLGDNNNDGDIVDENADQLTGSAGHDWFIVGSTDKITDINSKAKDGDTITNI